MIKNIKVFTRDPYSKKIYQYLVKGQLESGLQVELFDYNRFGFDLTNYENKEIECLIYIMHILNPKSPDVKIRGKYIKDCPNDLIKEWSKFNTDLNLKGYSALKTQDGFFLINHLKLNNYIIDSEDNLTIDIARFDLFAWHPIEE